MVAGKPRSPRTKDAAALGDTSSGLGARLRRSRERTGMTVRGMARAIGVSPSLVSQIERGRVMPSVGTLYAISNALGLLVDDLFREADAAPSAHGARRPAAAPARGPVQRHDARKAIRLADGVRWELLTPEPDDELEFLYVVYDVGGASCPEDSLTRHGGKEYAYVISGRLGVRIGFEEFELGPGDSLSFDAQMPHRLWTVGRKPAVAVWAVRNRHGDARSHVVRKAGRPRTTDRRAEGSER